MKSHLLSIILLCAAAGMSCAAPQPKDPEDLIKLRAIWEKTRKEATTPLTNSYFESLKALKLKLTQAGDIDAAIMVDNEIKTFAAPGKSEYRQSSKDEPAELTKLREDWEKGRVDAVSPTNIRYADALHGLKLKYTQAGDLDGAIAVDKEIKALATAAPPAPVNPAKDAAQKLPDYKPTKEEIAKFTGVRWMMEPVFVTKTAAENRWLKFNADGTVNTGWKKHQGRWTMIGPSKVEVKPFLDETRAVVLLFDALYKSASVEGENKSSTATRKE